MEMMIIPLKTKLPIWASIEMVVILRGSCEFKAQPLFPCGMMIVPSKTKLPMKNPNTLPM